MKNDGKEHKGQMENTIQISRKRYICIRSENFLFILPTVYLSIFVRIKRGTLAEPPESRPKKGVGNVKNIYREYAVEGAEERFIYLYIPYWEYLGFIGLIAIFKHLN